MMPARARTDLRTRMRISECIGCERFPCRDVRHESYIVPSVDLEPRYVSIVMISEAAPAERSDYYYAAETPCSRRNSAGIQDAGSNVSSIQDLIRLGVYFTTAVKPGKTGYSIEAIQSVSAPHTREGAESLPQS
jgi:hypothetical protein